MIATRKRRGAPRHRAARTPVLSNAATALTASAAVLFVQPAIATTEPLPPPLTDSTPLVPRLVIKGEPLPPAADRSLRKRMQDEGVPGLSVAVILDGQIAWAGGFGVADIESGQPVATDTLFQAASLSKPVAAAGALAMVRDGLMTLDGDISTVLTSWSIDAARPITLRHLLAHTSGATVGGFPGYPSGTTMPSAVGVLDGLGNTPAVSFATPPGTEQSYSGGGYTIAQLAMIDAAADGMDFPALMERLVLTPLGMTHSTFRQPLPEPRLGQAASGHVNGAPLANGSHAYPEMAAAGLWTTPTDYARFIIALQQSFEGADGAFLPPQLAKDMRTAPLDVQYGLGLNLGPERFGHGGGNAGFRCVFNAFFEGGNGAVIMTNSDTGWTLGGEVLRTLFVHYDWPGLRPIEKTVAQLTPGQIARCAGTYRIEGYGDVSIVVDQLGDRLLATAPDGSEFVLRPQSETVFFDPEDGVPVEFELPESGPATAFEWSGTRAERAP